MKHLILTALFFIGLLGSAIQPHDYFTWILEVTPAIIAFIALTMTYNRFRFTDMTYIFILVHCYILFVGGHYTYAEVPLFDWVKELFHQSRNNYDKLGHIAQGFVPAMVIRELFTRNKICKKGGWMAFITVSVCLAISAVYELIEWLVSLLTKEAGDSFLGTQGDIWDTQSDMFFAMIGAILMIVILSRLQDKAINKITNENPIK